MKEYAALGIPILKIPVLSQAEGLIQTKPESN